jgi:hypothetical protein
MSVCFKKYSRGTGGQIFVIYGQPMDSNIIISYALLRRKISYLNTKNCPDLNKGRYIKPSKSHAISFDRRLCDAPSWILSSQLITGTRLVSTPDIHPIVFLHQNFNEYIPYPHQHWVSLLITLFSAIIIIFV